MSHTVVGGDAPDRIVTKAPQNPQGLEQTECQETGFLKEDSFSVKKKSKSRRYIHLLRKMKR